MPESTNRLERLSAAIHENAKALEEYKDRISLGNAELTKYNELVAEGTALEAEQERAVSSQSTEMKGKPNETKTPRSCGTRFRR